MQKGNEMNRTEKLGGPSAAVLEGFAQRPLSGEHPQTRLYWQPFPSLEHSLSGLLLRVHLHVNLLSSSPAGKPLTRAFLSMHVCYICMYACGQV